MEAGEEISSKLRSVARKFLGRDVIRLGIIFEDNHVNHALTVRKPLLLAHPQCSASMEIRAIADLLTEELWQKRMKFHPAHLDERFKEIITKR